MDADAVLRHRLGPPVGQRCRAQRSVAPSRRKAYRPTRHEASLKGGRCESDRPVGGRRPHRSLPHGTCGRDRRWPAVRAGAVHAEELRPSSLGPASGCGVPDLRFPGNSCCSRWEDHVHDGHLAAGAEGGLRCRRCVHPRGHGHTPPWALASWPGSRCSHREPLDVSFPNERLLPPNGCVLCLVRGPSHWQWGTGQAGPALRALSLRCWNGGATLALPPGRMCAGEAAAGH
mmetsp:Transcript_32760/g.94086  ORF Transcript_32760/g.94086 Transcript_32760/m.94086 type:complete len:231 (-) Transcript_32760:200-892(-)